ncbi:MAG: HAMP domain-containing histidine kinase [Lachnospiraceae bacterium]|nr:HAMP domain-containing histidine kinase [Lachnospiraceae bacterium]
MGKIYRTTAVKVIIFILCVTAAAMCAAAGIGAVIMHDLGFYSGLPMQDNYKRFVSDMVINDWEELINSGIADENEDGTKVFRNDTGNLVFKAVAADDDGEVLFRTKNVKTRLEPGLSIIYTIEMYDMGTGSGRYYIRSISSDYYDCDYESFGSRELITYTLEAGFECTFPCMDIYALDYWLFYFGYQLKYAIYFIAIFFGLLAFTWFILLMCASARRRDDEDLHPGILTKVPFDIVLAAYSCITAFTVLVADKLEGLGSSDLYDAILLLICGIFLLSLTLGLCMDIAARIKQKSIFKNTVIYRCCGLLGKFVIRLVYLFVKLPFVWKSALILFGIICLDALGIVAALAASSGVRGLAVWFLLSRAVFAIVVIDLAVKLKSLQKAGEEMAGGNLGYVIDTKGMPSDLKTHAQNLAGISSILQTAVEQRLKSERMKTELITNVSHDIKTPLTSIINYADLMNAEKCDNPKHAEYCEVLIRQAGKLKKLIEDLVEASKASSGVLEVNPEPCDAALFVTQAAGEYEEKLRAAELTLIQKLPEEPVTIMADGRRMWRIFDNLMGNICKYSQPGTRVYLELVKDGEMAQFTFKNTSRDILNISEEELMERFVRGDVSRNTEGNGLGLSIAKSLAELQGGWLRLDIDGDLFKAILRFPCVNRSLLLDAAVRI